LNQNDYLLLIELPKVLWIYNF